MHQKENTHLALFFIVILGFAIRFYNFPNRIGWHNDIGRDYLAGYLLSHTPQKTSFGHWNSGMVFIYPAYYYNFIGILSSIADDELFITGFFTMVHALSIFTMYHVALLRFSKKVALCVAFLYAIHPYVVRVSLLPLSAHFALPLFLGSLYFLYSFITTRSPIRLALACSLLILISTFFYGALLFVPLYVLSTKFRPKELLLSILTFVISFGIFFYPLLAKGFFLNLIGFAPEQSNILITTFNPDQLHESINENLAHYFGGYTYVGLAVICFFTLYFLIHKKIAYDMIAFLLIFSIHVLLLSFKPLILPHYLLLVTPFFFLGVGSLLEKSLTHFKNPQRHFYLVFSLTLVLTGSLHLANTTSIKHEAHEYSQNKQLAGILESRYPNDIFSISEVSSPLEWDSRSLWYFLRHSQSFFINDGSSQLGQTTQATLKLCKKDIEEMSEFCNTFAEGKKLKYIETISLYPSEYLVFEQF